MSYLNVVINPTVTNSSILGSGSGTGSTTSKNMSKVTIFGFTILSLYSITKILNFYGVGVEKYGPYLLFYVFLILCANILISDHPKI